ncbi:efflux RND transporter periplasmic adaptor subunit [Massilia sp. Leaf139]|uniref:efflux RND transporter periplasmic adaptor subunit n=1 Tax=Massilia sp. Leaf139 TaxID=1736272 RepID=UPI001E483444|nr:efflux RND transporter periplasmic adaptor subunit [Massilia sp. Leaf139]
MSTSTRLNRRLAAPALLLCALLLTACSKEEAKPEPVRPVRAAVLTEGAAGASADFSGEVRPRIESRLGFRVAGKITAREVDVGSAVTQGQTLMQLDPQDLKLAASQAQASLRAAETNRDLANADYKRYQELRAKNFVSQSVLDTKRAALRAAQAEADAARAAFRGQSNQAGYASLVSDIDGVVTGIDAEVGQVVTAGTPVVRVARTDELDVVIGIPEDRVGDLRKANSVTVRMWAAPGAAIAGRVREVSPVADPATRTYTAKIAIPPSPNVRLGMTAAVQVASKDGGGGLRAPLTALHHEKGVTGVWLVENGAVRRVPVKIVGQAGNDVLLGEGVKAGQTVVTAGVNLLRQGQKVRILTADVARRDDTEAAASGAGAPK